MTKSNSGLAAVLLLPLLLGAQTPQPAAWSTISDSVFSLHYTAPDSATLPALLPALREGVRRVEAFFGADFPRRFDVYVFPGRAALDRHWQQDWGDSTFQSACWMVASGVAHRLDLLSPRVWATEACEHDAAKTRAVQQLLTHELVHVYHGQHNPVPDFTGLDDLAWWIEGLATYASGQLDSARLAGVQDLIRAGKAPDDLQKFWSGRLRYGQSGSVVAWMDRTFGRGLLVRCLAATQQEEIFILLQTDEAGLVARWQKYWLEQ